MSTYSLQRTNTRLTSNIKLVVSDDKLHLETINSNELLSRSIYKAYEYNKNLDYGTNIKNFARQFTNKDILFDVVDESRFDITDKTELQYHQLYDYGVYSDSSKLINANYRFLAPIHFSASDKTTHPDAFVIYKTSAISSNDSGTSELTTLINTSQIVKVFDLDHIKKIFKDIEQSSIDMQFKTGTITTGLSLQTGLMTTKQESIIDSMLANESTITEFENQLTNNFRDHTLIYSNAVNLEFAFNDVVDGSFVRYFGFYVKYNETAKSIADDYQNLGTVRLLRTSSGYIKYENSLQLSKYDVVRQSQLAVAFGINKKPEVKVIVNVNPVAGDKLIIKYNGIIEHTITFNTDNIGSNVNETANYIANQLTTNYAGAYSTLLAFVESQNTVVIRSNINSIQYEQLSITVPACIQIVQPIFTAQQYLNNFISSSTNTIILNTFYNPAVYNKLQYIDDAGIKRTSAILRVVKYNGDYLYILADAIVNKSNAPDTVWFVQTLDEQPIICSVLQHRDFDFDTTISQYTDVLDFDIVAYKSYLLSIINDPSFRGRADAVYDSMHPNQLATATEIIEYKTTMIDFVNKYFDSIDLNRNYLFNNIELSTEEATTINNEYERLNENSFSFLEYNRLYAFINKWSYLAGTDVYTNDYRLNIALSFRFDAFAPSIETINRDIRYHTHSWMVIGEGANPYLQVNESTIHKCLSYSRIALTKSMLLSTANDAYEYLSYDTNVQKYVSYANLIWNEEQSACYVFFRGILLRYDDKTLNNYRFSIVLLTQEPVQDDVVKLQYIRNDEFKTLTLLVNFYIPDPVLTTVERGQAFYFLDRSLLYFSENIYSTGQDAIDFGIDKISLTLYDTTLPKKYLGAVVTNNWYTTIANETLLYVSRGNVAIFNTNFNEILTVGQDFTIDFTPLTEDIANPGYGTQITFVNIQEVGVDHFWCKQILVKHIVTHDPDSIDDLNINDNIVDSYQILDVYDEFTQDNLLFQHNNIAYTSRAIALENCTYRKVVNAVSNNARYKEISASNILSLMNSTDIGSTDSNNQNSFLRASVIPPAKVSAVISLYQNNEDLERLLNPYLFPISRYDGKYQPATIVLNNFDSDDRFRNIYAKDFVETNRYKLNISRLSIEDARLKQYKETYNRDIKFQNFFEYKTTASNDSIVQLPWISNPIEWRSFVSIVFNSSENLVFQKTNLQQIVDISELLFDDVKQYCPISSFNLTDNDKLKILALTYDVSLLTMNNYDFEHEIVKHFIKSTFIKIYKLESIQRSTNEFVNFTVDDSILTILDSVDSSETLILNFKR